MLVKESSMASSLVSIDSAWIERKRLLISFMKNKSVYQIQVKSRIIVINQLDGAYSSAGWCIAVRYMVHIALRYAPYDKQHNLSQGVI